MLYVSLIFWLLPAYNFTHSPMQSLDIVQKFTAGIWQDSNIGSENPLASFQDLPRFSEGKKRRGLGTRLHPLLFDAVKSQVRPQLIHQLQKVNQVACVLIIKFCCIKTSCRSHSEKKLSRRVLGTSLCWLAVYLARARMITLSWCVLVHFAVRKWSGKAVQVSGLELNQKSFGIHGTRNLDCS